MCYHVDIREETTMANYTGPLCCAPKCSKRKQKKIIDYSDADVDIDEETDIKKTLPRSFHT